MKLKIAFLFLLSIIFESPVKAQTTVVDSFISGGLMRNYLLYIPAVYNPANPVPLVFNLHGYTSDNFQQSFYANFQAIADTANFIIALPNGTFDINGFRFWNTFSGSAVDDVGFISDLIDSISAQYNIDADRVYSTGMSNGGFMSYDLACNLSNRIAAVASVTGGMISSHMNNCNPLHPVPVMEIHGTADPTVPYAGNLSVEPVDSLLKFWAGFNHCNPVPVINPVPNTSTTDGCTADHFIYSGGDNGSKVEHFRVNGGAHTWPGAPIVIGVTNMDFSASQEIWRFFSQYRLNTLTSKSAVQGEAQEGALIYPNPSNGSLTFEFPETGERVVFVTSSTGQEVCRTMVNASSLKMDLPNTGIYFVTVVSGRGIFFRKVVVN